MALFDKKNCSVCGARIGLLGGHKLSDGNLCSDCAKKLSPWFSDYRTAAADSIRAQLADREENRKRLAVFKTTKCFGEYGSIIIDEDAGVFAAIEDSAASLFGARKEITDISQIIDRNPDVVRFDQVTDADIEIVQTQREEKQTVNGQEVSYNPKHILYMYMFYAVIRLDHPYISSMRIQLNNDAVQIPNEGERLRNKIGLRLAEYLLDLPIRDVRKTEKIYSNNSLKDVLTRNPYAMPDYSYGFRCSLRNREGIRRYGYYLLMTQEIAETLRNGKTATAAQPSASAVPIRFHVPYLDPDCVGLDLEITGELFADGEGGTEFVQAVAQQALITELQALTAERCSWRDLPAQAGRLTQACSAALAARNIRLTAFSSLRIEPDEYARRKIELLEKKKALESMTPEDLAKQLEEAQKQAQAALEKMTPEERRAAMENAQKFMKEQAAEYKQLMTQAGAAVASPEQPARTVPKFCPNCGSATNGAKFCSNCGTKL